MKHVHRFFTPGTVLAGQQVSLDGDESFHALRVLRLKSGDQVELVDGHGHVFDAVIASSSSHKKNEAVAVVAGKEVEESVAAPGGALTVVQALPKGRKMDLIAEKLSEIGVARLVPVISNYSVAPPAGGPEEKTGRWRRVAKAAAQQSKRRRIMAIDEPVELVRWAEAFSGTALVLATEVEGSRLGEAVAALGEDKPGGEPAARLSEGNDITLVVGPEAGFSEKELDLFKQRGFSYVGLGPLVLRTETAALVAAAVIMHRLGVIG